MTDQEKRETLEHISESMQNMDESQRQFVLGYAAGVIASHSGAEARQTA